MKQPTASAPEIQETETLELEQLETVTGGAMAWPAWTYKAAGWVARQDPAMLAANFIQ